jgi:hypothetical protein
MTTAKELSDQITKAMEAVTPGPWAYQRPETYVKGCVGTANVRVVAQVDESRFGLTNWQADLAYIAAASPVNMRVILSALADAELQSTADSRIAELEQQIANIKASRDLQVTIAAGEEERARKAEAKLAEAVKVIEQPFCVLFLDGRNEHGSHVLPSYPRSFEPVGDDIDDQAEAILVEAERLGFAIGEHVWAEFIDVPDQIGDEGRIEFSGYWEFKGINVEMSRVINASILSKMEGSSHGKA